MSTCVGVRGFSLFLFLFNIGHYMHAIKIATYNVNGLVNPIKRSKILTKLKRDKVEVEFLQETHLSDIEHTKLKRMGFKYQFSSSYANGYRRGVAILISNKICFKSLFERGTQKEDMCF